MDVFTQEIMKLQKMITKKHHWVVFDIDRTIINTTSWYHACATPNLFIQESDIATFLQLNEQTFGRNPTISKELFRQKTLGLISNYQQKAKRNYITKNILYQGGYAIGKKLFVYKEFITYVRYLSRFYGDSLHVLYLSAGYKPFMEGLIKRIYEKENIGNHRYYVFGSGITSKDGKFVETFFCHNVAKTYMAQSMIAKGASIVFAADDDDNAELLTIVAKHGGDVLRVQHNKNTKKNTSWHAYITHHLSLPVVVERLQKGNTICSFAKRDSFQSPFANVYKKLDNRTNKIGIVKLPVTQFTKARRNVFKYISSQQDREKLDRILSQCVFTTHKTVYLRGQLFYSLPSYITLDTRSNYQRWFELLSLSQKALELLNKHAVIDNWALMRDTEKLLILSFFDHYKNALLIAFNTLCYVSIKYPHVIDDRILSHLDWLMRRSVQGYYELLFDVPTKQIKQIPPKILYFSQISKLMNTYQPYQQGMRELDDPYVIVSSVISLFKEAAIKKRHYQYLIDFPCGGIELGLAFVAITKIVDKKRVIPHLIHCFYSSKKKLRGEALEESIIKEKWLYAYVPKLYHHLLSAALTDGKKVLLYDNNVTTFSTLADVKDFFQRYNRKKNDTAVAAIYYKNIARFLLGKHAEPVRIAWNKILTYHPVSDYVTAFNTWGTSEKGKILERIFFSKHKHIAFMPSLKNQAQKQPIFKICRVHNIFDFSLAIHTGANMIGVHAVYPQNEYTIGQQRHKPLIVHRNDSSVFPIASYERDSIKAMQSYIGSYIRQAIIFEKALPVYYIQKSFHIYGLDKKRTFLQLQHRLNPDYIYLLRRTLHCPLIVVIGLFQDDFQQYFAMLQKHTLSSDIILLDFSKHQPDILERKGPYPLVDKITVLKQRIPSLQRNHIPLVIADDVDVNTMKQYLTILKKNNIQVAGIDMQNSVELETALQRYRLIKDHDEIYQILIRKSPDKLTAWKHFVQSQFFRRLRYYF